MWSNVVRIVAEHAGPLGIELRIAQELRLIEQPSIGEAAVLVDPGEHGAGNGHGMLSSDLAIDSTTLSLP